MNHSYKHFRMFPLVYICLFLLITFILFVTINTVYNDNKLIDTDDRYENISKTSLNFEANVGQLNKSIHYISKTNNYTLYLFDSEAYLSFNDNVNKEVFNPGTIIGMKLKGGNQKPEISGLNEVKKKTNYYKGSNPNQWFTGIKNYAAVKYKNVYPGIDLVFYSNNGHLEYDFIISPSGNVRDICLEFELSESISIDKNGKLILSKKENNIFFNSPKSYQNIEEKKQSIPSEFVLLSENQVGFHVGDYNPDYPLIIDPVLVYSTYLGGTGFDAGKAIAVDNEGCAYVTGSTVSTDFPTYKSSQSELSPGMFNNISDIFVTKFNSDGTDILYSTYIGGRWDDSGEAITVDDNGQVYITGRTSSNDDPETAEYEGLPLLNAFQTERGKNSSDAFVVVLDTSGTLTYSSYLGGKGEDYGTDIAVDDFGCAYITGTEFSYDFPVKNAFMETKAGYYFDVFVTKIDPSKTGEASLIYSTHLGGLYDDYSGAIDVDGNGCAYVTGEAKIDFPVTANALQPVINGKKDAYVTKLSSDGSFLEFSTFLGDSFSNRGLDIKVDDAGFAYVSGNAQIQISEGAVESPYRAFLCKLDTTGNNFVYSARVGNYPKKIALDTAGNVYYNSFLGLNKGILISRLNAEGTESTAIDTIDELTDMALDNENLYFVGSTDSIGIATQHAFQTQLAGSSDALVSKLSLQSEKMIVKFFSDSLVDNDLPVKDALLHIYSIDLSIKDDPLTYIESLKTDDNGLLRLSKDRYHEGMPILVRFTPEIVPAIKKNRTKHTKHMYKIHLDNLIIDNEGKVQSQQLENNPTDTTKIYLNHTSIAFSLITSIEWKATNKYIADLATALQNVNNIFYDVTNGHAYIDTIAIFDDAAHWDDADIRIYASNLQWPCASVNGNKYNIPGVSVKFPPVHHGNKDDNINLLYNSDPINPNTKNHITTIVHELGHYLLGLYDEYRDLSGNRIFPPPDSININFGFMDSQYDLNDPRSSEMSNYLSGDSLFDYYKITDQYQNFQKNCWEYFQSSYLNIYNNAVSYIHTPNDIGIPSDDVIAGPNDDLFNPDFSVGDMMGFEFNVKTSQNPRRDILIVDNSGTQLSGAETILRKSTSSKTIVHGSTNSAGRIKLFDAAIGDSIMATHQDLNNWKYKKAVIAPNPTLKGAGSPYQTVQLKSVQGPFTMLSSLTFNEISQPVYTCLVDPDFISLPYIWIVDNTSQTDNLHLNESNGFYSVDIKKPNFTEGAIYFNAPDNDGEEFFVIQDAVILELDNSQENNFVGPRWEFYVDSSITSANKVSLLTSSFPAPLKGISDASIRVSDVVSFGMYPDDSDFAAKLQINYYSSLHEVLNTQAIRMYKWNDGWMPMETGVDLRNHNVTAKIHGSGYYSAFLDPEKNKIATDGTFIKKNMSDRFALHSVYPNPFRYQTTIEYHLTEPGFVVIKIYNITGQEVATLVNEYQPTGHHKITWRPYNMPEGIYIAKSEIYNSQKNMVPPKTKTIKMLYFK